MRLPKHPVESRSAPIAHRELPATPTVVETRKVTVSETPRAAAAPVETNPTPIIKTKLETPPQPPKIIKPAGFESVDAIQAAPIHSTVAAIGSFESAHSIESSPARGVLAKSAGFSDASTGPSSVSHQTAIRSAAFGDTSVEKNTTPVKRIVAAASVTAVEIISKPKPVYTAEARARKIEGEVLLEVQFNAAGDAQIIRVVRGLAASLDETAIAAARGIRFRPAMRDGVAVDSTAFVHIFFQLAD
jgi:TonB family protein